MLWTLYGGITAEYLGAVFDYPITINPVKHPGVKYTPLAAEK
jgi:hypothetical protein